MQSLQDAAAHGGGGDADGVRIPPYGQITFGTDSGATVDQIVVPEYVTVAEVRIAADDLPRRVAEAAQLTIAMLKTSTRRRTRDRRVTFWLGYWRSTDEPFLCLNDDTATDVWDCLRRAGQEVDLAIVWGSRAVSSDLDLRPIANYQQGIATSWLPTERVHARAAPDFDRVGTALSTSKPLLPARATLPDPGRAVPPGPHTDDVWESNGKSLLSYFEARDSGPRSYRQLKLVLRRGFGIEVVDTEPLPSAIHGRLISSASGTPVIQVSPAHDDATKQLTISHELGHYLLHWPLALEGKAIDDLKGSFDGLDADEIERNADAIGSITIMSNRWLLLFAELGEATVEHGQPLTAEEAIWRYFMQGVYPDRPVAGWADLPALDVRLRAATAHSLNDVPRQELHVRLFHGLMRRLEMISEWT
jgi:hypothetical protein